MRQITEQEAIIIHNKEIYKDWTDYEKVKFQLFQERLSMPWIVFHEAVQNVLGRPVYTPEFSNALKVRMQKEFLGEKADPTFQEIVNLIPKEKLIIVST